MDWVKKQAKDGTDYVMGSAPAEEASNAVDTISDETSESAPNKDTFTTASILNSAPFSSFKPDPAVVWQGYLIYLLLGAGCTLPWWTFVIGADYFDFRYPDSHILRLFPLIYFGPWLVMYVLFTAFGRQYTSWARINCGFIISLLTLLAIPIMEGFFIKGYIGTRATFWATLGVVALAGAGDSIAQGSLLGLTSELPERFSHAYSMGTSFSGIIMLIVRVIAKGALSSSPTGLRISALIYFSFAPVVIIGVLSLFAYVHYMPAIGYYDSLGLGSMDTVRLLVQDEDTVTIEIAAAAGIAAVVAGKSSPVQPLHYGAVFSRVKLLAVAVIVTALISLLIFPGFLVEDVHSKTLGTWYPLLLVGTYLVFDLVGRSLTKTIIPDRHSTLFSACARLIIILFFVFAIFGHGPATITMVFALTALLGATNGYLLTCLTILIPRENVSDQKEPAGIIMVTLMTVGNLIGAGLSWLWVFV